MYFYKRELYASNEGYSGVYLMSPLNLSAVWLVSFWLWDPTKENPTRSKVTRNSRVSLISPYIDFSGKRYLLLLRKRCQPDLKTGKPNSPGLLIRGFLCDALLLADRHIFGLRNISWLGLVVLVLWRPFEGMWRNFFEGMCVRNVIGIPKL